MTASDSFRATILFSVLALAGLLAGNLAAALAGASGWWSKFGVFASLLAIGAAYGCQLMTTNGLTCDEAVPKATNQTDVQALREGASILHRWASVLQVASLFCAIVAGLALLAAL